ncbi:MAG: FkbM family methyltransferase [Parvibaculum sp.]|uniref:FkbM family methyltransferase n=1 Tax=Parvibaculum sp. TaxID=2024848 RepID=UPI00272EFCBF|nr:FkbM family methyltransferase [Parvibaculum sp.]MDP2151302.1 FkbM family methyltransferase [Parvibaculum sp.]
MAETDDEAAAPFGRYAPSAGLTRMIGLSRAMNRGNALRPLGRLIRHMTINRLGARPVDDSFRGLRARFHPIGNVCEKRALLSPAEFDAEEFAFAGEVLAPGDICLDVGANVGFYSLFFASRVGPQGKVIAFEPHPLMFARLKTNIALNPDISCIVPENCAVYSQEGEMALVEGSGNFGETKLGNEGPGTVTVKVVRLSRYLETGGLSPVKLMKIDVEGAEGEVFADLFAAPQTFHPRYIIVEFGKDGWDKTRQACTDAGYVRVAKTRMNEILEKR